MSPGEHCYIPGLPEICGIKLKAAAVEIHGKQIVVSSSHAHMDRLLGDVTVLHSPFFGSGKLEYYLAARRPALEVRGVDAFEPVANLQRCFLRRDPVFLRSLLRLLIRPAAQQLLGKVGLLRAAAAAGTEQRAASAAASDECDRAMPGHAGLSTRSALPGSPALHLC